MTRLSGLDATFLYTETPTAPMHTLKVAICDGGGRAPDDLFDSLRHELAMLLPRLPGFGLRLMPVPFGLHHPEWAPDPHLDLDAHLHLAAVPGPGGSREMDHVIAEVAAAPLRRDRPLWELWLLHGLAGGRVAYVAKMHHAIADGCASATMLVHATGSVRALPLPPPAPLPRRRELLGRALSAQPRKWAALAPLVGRTLRGAAGLARHHRRDLLDGFTRTAPRTVLNGRTSRERRFATAELPLDHLKSVRSALDVRLNDVLLAIVGRGVRRSLEVPPEGPLVAAVPVGLGQADIPRMLGNRLSNLLTSLHTDIDDPVAQVLAIAAGTARAKRIHSRAGADLMGEWAEYAPGALMEGAARLYARFGLADHHPPAANLVVSNVRGPGQAIELGGTRIEQFYSVGPVPDGVGLNVTAWSYRDRLGLGLLADAEAVPDPHGLAEHIRDALALLTREVGARASA